MGIRLYFQNKLMELTYVTIVHNQNKNGMLMFYMLCAKNKNK